MNKMLFVVFDNEQAAEAGTRALRSLHAQGEITLYAVAVIIRDAGGKLSVKELTERRYFGTGVGLAVGGLIGVLGLLGGPVGFAVGAVTGTLAGAIRDFWVAGVDLDFIEESERLLLPGKFAVVAEVEEEGVVPVDSALEAAGGVVFRRTRSEANEAHFDHGIAALKGEIAELEAEALKASGPARTKLQAQVVATATGLDRAVRHATQRVEALKREADGKAAALNEQLSEAQGDARRKLEGRLERLRSAYHARAAKLSQAWGLTKER